MHLMGQIEDKLPSQKSTWSPEEYRSNWTKLVKMLFKEAALRDFKQTFLKHIAGILGCSEIDLEDKFKILIKTMKISRMLTDVLRIALAGVYELLRTKPKLSNLFLKLLENEYKEDKFHRNIAWVFARIHQKNFLIIECRLSPRRPKQIRTKKFVKIFHFFKIRNFKSREMIY
jgi:hypothetical protein